MYIFILSSVISIVCTFSSDTRMDRRKSGHCDCFALFRNNSKDIDHAFDTQQCMSAAGTGL